MWRRSSRVTLTLKDEPLEAELFKVRALVCYLGAIALTAVLVGRMANLQLVEYEHFATLSEDNRVKLEPVPPIRGLIYDRNGVLLAENLPTFNLEVVPERVRELGSVIANLEAIVPISAIERENFEKRRLKHRRFDSVALKLRLNEQEVARFAVNRHLFPGVDVHATLSRRYVHGSRGAHVLGYVGRISETELPQLDTVRYRGTQHVGKTGIEQAYESILHGDVGVRRVEINAGGRILRVLDPRRDPKPGYDIFLTIDFSLQSAAEDAFGDQNGALVAIEPSTGAILALVSKPTFDPNAFVDGIDVSSYRKLLQSENLPLFNRAVHGQYPPGSTVKPFIALAGLELEVPHATQTTTCIGYYQLPGRAHRYRDWRKGGHGKVDLTRSIVESCDVYYYELALEMGITPIHDFLTRFGFGERTGIALKGEAQGVVPSAQWKRRVHNQAWYPGETLITGIGQGFSLTTPLQLAAATATLANGGVRYRPQLIHRAVNPGTGEVREMRPEAIAEVAPHTEVHWQQIYDAMEAVVHGPRGTARAIGRGLSYRMAGKTGTAQVRGIAQDEEYDEEKVEKRYRDHGLFIGFAPLEQPSIAVAVIVENGGSGSRSAAPVARKVFDHYLLHSTKGEKVIVAQRRSSMHRPNPLTPIGSDSPIDADSQLR